ncbi:unnamed protein product [Rotaria sp. Silwood2]|nr:unnamed protein product [Rotaria sp. Silwood2]
MNMLRSLRRQLIKFTEVFLSYHLIKTPVIASSTSDAPLDRNSSALAKRNRRPKFLQKLAQEFSKELRQLSKSSSTEKRQQDLNQLQECTRDTMNVFEKLYVGTTEQMDENTNQCKEATAVLAWCNHYQEETILPLRSTLNSLLASHFDRWSLSADMIYSKKPANGLSNDEMNHVFKAKLKYTRTCTPIPVYLRRLSGDFCALHVCNQTRSIDKLRHPNILHCYGAYREGNDVYVVTEPWKMLLKTAINGNWNLSLEQSLQMAVELTELCSQMPLIISNEQLTPDKLVIGKESHIKLNLQFPDFALHNFIGIKQKRRGLLAIDGGGSRGIIAAKILEHLESAIGKPLWDCFDYAAGVSTGGLLVLSALLRRTPSNQLVPMYLDLCDKIFPSRFSRFGAYSAIPLELELEKHFGETRMKRLDHKAPHVFVVTKRNYEPEPYLLRNYDVPDNVATFKGESGWLCSKAARATSAAPTFFRPVERDKMILLLSESGNGTEDENRCLPNIDYIVSIGTGKMDGWPAPTSSPKSGISRVFETVQLAVELLTDFENSHHQMQMLAKACGNIPYFRFNPELPERVPLDIRTKAELDKLVNLTTDYLSDHNSGIPEQIEQLRDLVNSK